MTRIPLRIGTRGSPLALTQTRMVQGLLQAAVPALCEPGALEIVVVSTTGDRVLDRPLAEVGGKGLFCKEIDEAMLDGRIDLGVHSVKDLPTWLVPGIVLGAVLPREDPRDVLVGGAASIAALPAGAVVGTSSPRRQAQVLAARPDVRVESLRGNVHTRLRKLAAGEMAATLLALAGLRRLGLEEVGSVLDPAEMLPAAGQGAVGVTCRAADDRGEALLAEIADVSAAVEVTAERAMLGVLDGSCRTPIGGLARLGADGGLTLRGLVARPDGSELLRGDRCGRSCDAAAMGEDLGRELRARAGDGFFVE